MGDARRRGTGLGTNRAFRDVRQVGGFNGQAVHRSEKGMHMVMQPIAESVAATIPPKADDQPDLDTHHFAQWRSTVYQLERRAALQAGFTIGSVNVTNTYKLLVIDVGVCCTDR